MRIPILPFTLMAVGLTFALALLGWWIAQAIERKRRVARRIAETNRRWQEQGGAQRPTDPT